MVPASGRFEMRDSELVISPPVELGCAEASKHYACGTAVWVLQLLKPPYRPGCPFWKAPYTREASLPLTELPPLNRWRLQGCRCTYSICYCSRSAQAQQPFCRLSLMRSLRRSPLQGRPRHEVPQLAPGSALWAQTWPPDQHQPRRSSHSAASPSLNASEICFCKGAPGRRAPRFCAMLSVAPALGLSSGARKEGRLPSCARLGLN